MRHETRLPLFSQPEAGIVSNENTERQTLRHPSQKERVMNNLERAKQLVSGQCGYRAYQGAFGP